jgi:hypothetical protein
MKSNSNIDELLCSFIDGELPPRQKTEVQRMVARDPEVGQRLRQLQNCSNLVSALPRAEAPGDMIEQIRLSLERRTLLGERPASSSGRAGRWHLRMRRMMAAAAMIALLGGLGLVVYQILAPIAPTTTPGLVANSGGTDVVASEPTVVVASEGFSGRLEFHTAAMVQANSVVEGAIRENGLTEVAQAEGAEGKRIFHLTCSREAAEQLVADLGSIWENSESVALLVESDRFNDSVAVNSPTLQQATRIIGAESAEASLAVAKLENLAEEMPGHSIVAAASEGVGEAIDVPLTLTLPRPRLVSGNASAGVVPAATEGSVKTTLTIVLSDTRQ